MPICGASSSVLRTIDAARISPGPICRSVEDCALLLNALAAPDAREIELLRAMAIEVSRSLERAQRRP